MSTEHIFEFSTGGRLCFQDGPVQEHGVNGVQALEVLGIVATYLNGVNTPPFRTRETSLAITKIEEAQHWLEARTNARVKRVVEGTNTP